MQIAIDCAGFSADRGRPAAAGDELQARRRSGSRSCASGCWPGWPPAGIPAEVAEDIYVKILAFSSYGFPESHAISFAYLVYASAWLKCYYPAAFTAALLRAQPMGFYSPGQPDQRRAPARRHGARRGRERQRRARDPGKAEARDGAATRRRRRPVRQPAIRLGLSEVRNLGTGRGRRDRGRPAVRRTWRTSPGAPRLPAAVAGGAGHGGRVRLLRPEQARGAVGGRGRGDHPARPAARAPLWA